MIEPKCAACKTKLCTQGVTDEELLPSYCPTTNFKGLVDDVKTKYQSEELKSFFQIKIIFKLLRE